MTSYTQSFSISDRELFGAGAQKALLFLAEKNGISNVENISFLHDNKLIHLISYSEDQVDSFVYAYSITKLDASNKEGIFVVITDNDKFKELERLTKSSKFNELSSLLHIAIERHTSKEFFRALKNFGADTEKENSDFFTSLKAERSDECNEKLENLQEIFLNNGLSCDTKVVLESELGTIKEYARGKSLKSFFIMYFGDFTIQTECFRYYIIEL